MPRSPALGPIPIGTEMPGTICNPFLKFCRPADSRTHQQIVSALRLPGPTTVCDPTQIVSSITLNRG